MNGAYLQLGYVTNDFDQAIRQMQAVHRLGAFKEMRELTIETRPGLQVTAHFGLAFKDETQFEIIHPLAGDRGFYADVLPDEGFAIRFHHLGHYYPALHRYEEAKAEARARWPMPVDVAAFGGFYTYMDARKDFGHYIEMFSFPPEEHFEGVPRY